jgi:hypothetical protein
VAIAVAGAVGLIVTSGPASAAPVVTQFTSPGVVTGGYTVPAGVCFVTVVADGGQGGQQFGSPGLGAQVSARFAVTPAEVLGIFGAGAGGNGGGGGGSSFTAGSALTTSSALSSLAGDGQVSSSYDPTTDVCPAAPTTTTPGTPTPAAAVAANALLVPITFTG